MKVRRELDQEPRFELGAIGVTPGAAGVLDAAGLHPIDVIARHIQGDWGDVDVEWAQENELAVEQGGRIASVYVLPTGARVGVVTQPDGSETTVIKPEDAVAAEEMASGCEGVSD